MTVLLENRKKRITKIIDSKEKILNRLSTYRIISFALILFSIVAFYLSKSSLWLSAPIVLVLVLAFAFIIRIFNRNEFSLSRYKDCNTFLTREILRTQKKTKELFRSIPVSEEIRNSHSFCEDLNLFEKDGIFPLIDTTCSTEGEKIFLDNLLRLNPESAIEINLKQNLTKLFSSHKYFSYKYLRIASEDWEFFLGKKWSLNGWKKEKISFFDQHKFLKILFPILSPVSFIAILGSWIFAYPFGTSFLILNLILFLKYRSESIRIFSYFEEIHSRSHQTEKLLLLLQFVLKKWNKNDIINLFSKFRSSMSTLWKAPLPHFILNALYLHDLWVIKKLSKWSDSTYDMRLELTKQLEMVDSIMPWIHLKFINPDWIFPVISDDLAEIKGLSLSHPLLKPNQSISNPLDPIQKGEVLLITGSNMAGKTTFMRTVGVNILFALCGGPTTAKNLSLPSLSITCSVRNHDSLTEGISLFYAEAKRLGEIFHSIKNKSTPTLILLDEILKGTNTKERYIASDTILKKLQGQNTFTLCTTHDLDLAKIPNLKLKHFTETIDNGEMKFDFKIRDGVVETTNALFILKKEGVI
jgi:hypothetical protein